MHRWPSVILLAFVSGCGVRLTHKEAEDVIRASEKFHDIKLVEFQTFFESSQPFKAWQPSFAVEALLVQTGFLKPDENGWILHTGNPELFAPGAAFRPRGNNNMYVLPIATREFVRVSGISREPPTARVEVEWRWTPTRIGRFFTKQGFGAVERAWVTAYTQQLREGRERNADREPDMSNVQRYLEERQLLFDERQVHQTVMLLRHYDSGWRVE